jgi:DNA-binding NarL/FixJ family response regulator
VFILSGAATTTSGASSPDAASGDAEQADAATPDDGEAADAIGTDKKHEAARRLLEGLSSNEIAARQGNSVTTIRHHVSQITQNAKWAVARSSSSRLHALPLRD